VTQELRDMFWDLKGATFRPPYFEGSCRGRDDGSLSGVRCGPQDHDESGHVQCRRMGKLICLLEGGVFVDGGVFGISWCFPPPSSDIYLQKSNSAPRSKLQGARFSRNLANSSVYSLPLFRLFPAFQQNCVWISAVTPSPTVPIYPPSLQNSPPKAVSLLLGTA
jgi:hypothetical protein